MAGFPRPLSEHDEPHLESMCSWHLQEPKWILVVHTDLCAGECRIQLPIREDGASTDRTVKTEKSVNPVDPVVVEPVLSNHTRGTSAAERQRAARKADREAAERRATMMAEKRNAEMKPRTNGSDR